MPWTGAAARSRTLMLEPWVPGAGRADDRGRRDAGQAWGWGGPEARAHSSPSTARGKPLGHFDKTRHH